MRVLLVEDNEKLSRLVARELQKAGFNTVPAFTADEAFAALSTSHFDLIILDLGLPDQDGMTVLKTIRSQKNTTPILILTARDTLDQKIQGLNAGADDYLTKPFAIEELIARLRVILRRPAQTHGSQLNLGRIVFDTLSRQAEINSKIVKLSKRETTLLELMMRSSGKIVPKERIELTLYGHGEEGSANSVEVLVHRLKKKLSNETANIEIHTLRGIGYMMVGTGDEGLV